MTDVVITGDYTTPVAGETTDIVSGGNKIDSTSTVVEKSFVVVDNTKSIVVVEPNDNPLPVVTFGEVGPEGAGGAGSESVTPDNVVTFTNKTLDDYSNNIHADQLHSHVKALEFIPAGSPVRFAGYNQGENAVEVYLADNTIAPAIGISEEDILQGEFGLIATHGTMQRVDTSGYSAGAILYPDSFGGLTDIPPETGFQQPIAYVLRVQKNNGAILVSAGYPKQDTSDIRGVSSFIQTLLDDESAADARDTLGISSSSNTGQVFTSTVLSGENKSIESFPIDSYRSVKWVVTATKIATGHTRTGEVMAHYSADGPSHIYYGVFGSSLLYTIDVVADQGDLQLRVTNGDSDTLRFDVVRVGITPV